MSRQKVITTQRQQSELTATTSLKDQPIVSTKQVLEHSATKTQAMTDIDNFTIATTTDSDSEIILQLPWQHARCYRRIQDAQQQQQSYDTTMIRSKIQHCAVAVLQYLFGVLQILVGALVFCLSKLQLELTKQCLWLVTGKTMDILSGTDAAMMYIFSSAMTDPICPAITQLVMRVKGEPNVQQFARRLKDTLVLHSRGQRVKAFPRLTQKVVRRFGYYVWEEDERFSVDAKVRLSEEGYADEASLVQLLQKIYEQPLQEDSPLWECVLLPKISRDSKDSEESKEYAILGRIHHCMCDGTTAIKMCHALFDEPPLVNTADMPGQKQSPLVPNNAFLRLLMNSQDMLTMSSRLKMIFNALAIAFKAPWHVVMNASQEPEHHALHQPSSAHDGRRWFAISKSISIKTLKDVGLTYNCTINDIFLFCASGAFQRQDAAADRQMSKHLRVSMAIHLLQPGGGSQNGMTSAILAIPLTDDRSSQWLETISKVSRQQQSSSALVSYFLINLAMGNHFPRAIVKFLVKGTDLCSLATTNLRGPTSARTILGGTVMDLFVLPNIFASAAVSFSLLSYNGCIRVGVAVDRTVAPNQHIAQKLVNDFAEELQNLSAMASAKLPKH